MPDDPRARRALELIHELSRPGSPRPRLEASLDSLGFDSLAFAELDSALEAEFGITLTETAVDGSATVGDVVSEVRSAQRDGPDVDVPRGVGRLQRPARLLAGFPLRWWLDLQVTGAGIVPRSGPVILAMNHESALDIPIAVVACPRRITFMAKHELFKGGFRSRSLHELGGFRVDRERFDLHAVRVALAVLRRGEVLGMYPEGTRSPGELLPFLHGAAWLALRTGAPLVPVTLSGTERAGHASRPRRVRVGVTFADPIEVDRADDPAERRRRIGEITAEIRTAVGSNLHR